MAASLILLASVLSAVAAGPIAERIAGGAVTTIATYPFAASISYNRLGFGTFTFTCGGSIISSRSILTAAFCVYGDQPNRYRVRVGSLTTGLNGLLHTVDYFTVHSNYNPVTKENDIALIHVFPHILFTSNVQLANFADRSYIPTSNQSVMAIGWGQINHGGALSDSLRRVQLWLVDNNECKRRYSELEGPNVTSNMICASGFDPSGKGQCLGDNGSPILDDRLIIASPVHERIAGGAITTIATYPYAASISYNRLGFGNFVFSCGGSIVSSRAILTAAFCVYKDEITRFRVRVGALSASSAGSVRTVDYIATHPNYNPVTHENDIALVHIYPHLLFSSTIGLGKFADDRYLPRYNQSVWAIGWGQINYGGALSESLRRVQLFLVDSNECNNRYAELNGPRVTSNMICAVGFNPAGRGQCPGDNGSPIVDNDLIIGIYSWSHQCATVRFPGVNTFIAKYSDWIKSQY
ncbi:unnamed protein product [Danaus chrysippus]|uniref:(African queen) hypothetical protein n=1 Tax=Danaus chrysippus TaxID=151541 RepID=A0A8J2R8U3_9NEOP|nr:unnamed protein product [Danaus chrysippus]